MWVLAVVLLLFSRCAFATVAIDPAPVLAIVTEVLAFFVAVGLAVLLLYFTARAYRWARGEGGAFGGPEEYYVCDSCGERLTDDELEGVSGSGDEGVLCAFCGSEVEVD